MISIDDYSYPLPDERIAKYPLAERDHSKLLTYKNNLIGEDHFYNIGNYINDNALLVYNNTRVIQARIVFHKPSGARIEIFCLEPLQPRDYALCLGSTNGCCWRCMIGNAKKWKDGQLSLLLNNGDILYAEKKSCTGNTYEVAFSWNNADLSFAEILDQIGELPIPPYLNRQTEESDKTTYQTVYSRIKGSVAAPTAGLHFTDTILNSLRTKGISTTELTLHVGAGTFQPVKTTDVMQHTMHTEVISVEKQTIQTVLQHLGNIVAVGTTSMRTLESLYYIGEQLHNNPHTDNIHVDQFVPYNQPHTLTTHQALQTIIDYLDATLQTTLHAETQIMIMPSFRFRIVDQLITNFHQPRSTLLLLVSAFVGDDWQLIYNYALDHDFRFLSYGDSSILNRKQND